MYVIAILLTLSFRGDYIELKSDSSEEGKMNAGEASYTGKK